MDSLNDSTTALRTPLLPKRGEKNIALSGGTSTNKYNTSTNKKDVVVASPLKDAEPLPFQLEKTEIERGFLDIYRFADVFDIVCVVFGILAAIMNGACQPLLAVLMGKIFGGQAGLNSKALEEQIHENIKFFWCLAGVAFTLNYVQFFCFMKSSERIVRRMKNACFESLLKQDVSFFDENPVGILSTRVSEQSLSIVRGIGDTFGSGIQFTFQFITGFMFAFIYNWKVAFAMLLFMPAIAICLGGLIFVVVKYTKLSAAAYEKASAISDETFTSIHTVAAFNGQKETIRKYDAKLEEAQAIGINLAFWRSIGLGALFCMIFFASGFGYFFGAHLISRGGEDFGGIFTAVFSSILGSLGIGIAMPNLAATTQAKVGSAILYKLIDRTPKGGREEEKEQQETNAPRGENEILNPYHNKTDEDSTTTIKSIEFVNVKFAYPTRREVLVFSGKLNLKIEFGHNVALVGPSGSGKSSIIALLQRFYDPTGGMILINGVNLKQFHLKWLRSKMGLVSQEPVLWDTSIADNIRTGKHDATMAEIEHVCKLADCFDFISSLPHGFLTRVGHGGSHLSGGQKQRICIARALIKNPDVLLLDEGTSALDEKAQKLVQKSLDNITQNNKSRITISIAHRLSTIKHCDTIYVMSEGEVKEQGSHASLMALKGVYYALINSQEEEEEEGKEGSPTMIASISEEENVSSSSVISEGNNNNNNADKMIYNVEASNLFNTLMMSAPNLNSSPLIKVTNFNDTDSPAAAAAAAAATQDEQQDENGAFLINKTKQVVSLSRLFSLSKEEGKWFIFGFLGSAIKGSTQPCLSLILSHIMSHLILIPSRIEGVSYTHPCTSHSNCGGHYSYCLKITDLFPNSNYGMGFCTFSCSHNEQCVKEFSAAGSTCYNLASVGIGSGLCVPKDAWMEGHAPHDVIHAGNETFGLYALLGGCAALGMAFQAFSFGLIGEKLTKKLRLIVFQSVIKQDQAFFDDEKNNIGSLGARLSNDASLIKTVTCEYTGLFAECFASICVALTIALVSSWRMALMMMLISPFLVFATYFQQRNLLGRNKTGVEGLKASAAILAEAVRNVRTVYSFNAENRILSLYDDALNTPYLEGVKNAHIVGFGNGVSQSLFSVTYAIGFSYGAYLLGQGLIDSRSMSRSFFAMTLTATTLGQSLSRTNDWAKAKNAMISIFTMADTPSSIDYSSHLGVTFSPDDVKTLDLKFDNVTFAYPTRKDVTVLKNVSLEIPFGQNVAFVGESGCGKSSIIRLLLRFYDPVNGALIVNGSHDLRRVNLKWWRDQIGFVQQEPILFRESILFNVRYGNPSASNEEVKAVLDASNSSTFIREFPMGLKTQVTTAMLSGGQKQRICIARALLKNPKILLLDEATSALDEESQKTVQDALDGLMIKSNRTTVVVAHRLSTIRNSDCIFVMERGILVEKGTFDELKVKNGVFSALIKAQHE